MCDGCHRQLTIQKYIGKGIIGLGALILCAGLFIAVADNNQTTVPFLTNLAARLNLKVRPYDLLPVAIVIGGTLLALAGKLVTLPGIFSTNGRTYKFHNKKFQAAFARLNPDRVK